MGFYRECSEKALTYRVFTGKAPRSPRRPRLIWFFTGKADLHWFLNGRPREGPVQHREGPEKAPTYIDFCREGPAHPVWVLQ